MTPVRVRDAFARQHQRRKPLAAYPLTDSVPLSSAVTSVATQRAALAFRSDSVVCRDEFSERRARACEQVVKR